MPFRSAHRDGSYQTLKVGRSRQRIKKGSTASPSGLPNPLRSCQSPQPDFTILTAFSTYKKLISAGQETSAHGAGRQMKQSVGQTFGTLQTPTDIKEQLQAHSFMPQEGPKCDQMGMLTASGQALQQTAACHPDELVKQRGLGCEMPTDCTCGPTLRASVDFGARYEQLLCG